jgi:adenosylhomocysteine nucleosidase
MSSRETDYGGARAGWAEPGRWKSGAVQFVFVAALEREVRGVLRGWSSTELWTDHAERRIYYSSPQAAALVCAGTGRERAYSAAKACIEEFSPRVVVSIGFAGACVPELRPGAVVIPARLVVPGQREPGGELREYRCVCGSGTVASLDEVTSTTGKQQAHERYGALALEMEAAGVAAAAGEFGREFLAIKAISDGVEEDLDFLSPFVTPEGFATGRFLAYVAMQPRLWGRVAELNRNSKLAAAALERAVGECCSDWQGFAARHS